MQVIVALPLIRIQESFASRTPTPIRSGLRPGFASRHLCSSTLPGKGHFKVVRCGYVSRRKIPDLPAVEFWRLVENCDKSTRANFVCLAVTGLRVGEYMTLREAPPDAPDPTNTSRWDQDRRVEDVITIGEQAWLSVEAAVPSMLRYG